MGRPRSPQNPSCPRCGASKTVSKGHEKGRPRWHCRACGRSFGQTAGTPLYRLKTDTAEIIRAIQVVLHRGSLRAAEEQTGHNYDTIAAWIKRLGDHAEALTDLLVHDLHLSEVELDELWSFVGQRGAADVSRARRPSPSRRLGRALGRRERGAGEPLRRRLGERAARRDVGRADRDRDPRPDRRVGDDHLRHRRLGGVRDGGQAGVLGAGSVGGQSQLGDPHAPRQGA
jgi:transposase-like protein